jgi:glycosyltransferase involved in cell wall biosynthesis
MKIAIFTETFLPNRNGVANILCLTLKRLQEHGHQVLLFGPPGGPAQYAGAEVIGVGGPRLPLYPELHINIPSPYIGFRVQRFRPDVIHLANPISLGVFGLFYAQVLQVPIVASFHTNIPHYLRYYLGQYIGGAGESAVWGVLRSIHNQAHINLATSTMMQRDLRKRGFKRMRWWKRGIDTDLFKPGARDAAVRERLTDGHPDDFLVINVGRHAPEKGLETIRDNLFPQPGVRLALVGDGPSHEQLKAYYQGTPTVLPGYLEGEDLVAAYRAADVFLLSSTTETFGLVALEAMACGVPVIAARSGGVLDTVIEHYNGLYYNPDTPQEMGQQVRRLREQPALCEELAANALAHAQSRCWRATMDQLIDYYHLARRLFLIRQARFRRIFEWE